MKAIAAVFVSLISFLAGCNSVGRYDCSVFRLDESAYRVNLGTWIGSGHGWPKGSEELKSKSEEEALSALHKLGLDVEACGFRSFIPYEGGHIVVCLIAGKKEAVRHWVSLPIEEFDQILRDRPMQNEVVKFHGEFPDHHK